MATGRSREHPLGLSPAVCSRWPVGFVSSLGAATAPSSTSFGGWSHERARRPVPLQRRRAANARSRHASPADSDGTHLPSRFASGGLTTRNAQGDIVPRPWPQGLRRPYARRPHLHASRSGPCIEVEQRRPGHGFRVCQFVGARAQLPRRPRNIPTSSIIFSTARTTAPASSRIFPKSRRKSAR